MDARKPYGNATTYPGCWYLRSPLQGGGGRGWSGDNTLGNKVDGALYEFFIL